MPNRARSQPGAAPVGSDRPTDVIPGPGSKRGLTKKQSAPPKRGRADGPVLVLLWRKIRITFYSKWVAVLVVALTLAADVLLKLITARSRATARRARWARRRAKPRRPMPRALDRAVHHHPPVSFLRRRRDRARRTPSRRDKEASRARINTKSAAKTPGGTAGVDKCCAISAPKKPIAGPRDSRSTLR
jgi:hypothetical protein